MCKAFYDTIATMIANRMSSTDFAQGAPQAKHNLRPLHNGNKDGIDMLYILLTKTYPFLGRLNFDITALINTLEAKHGMLLDQFIEDARDISAQITLSGQTTAPNALLDRFFDQIMVATNVQNLLPEKSNAYAEFKRSTGNNAEYLGEDINSLIEWITRGNPPETLVIPHSSSTADQHDNTRTSPFSHRRVGNMKSSGFNKPIYAQMSSPTDTPDDATVEEEEQQVTNKDVIHQEAEAIMEHVVAPIFAALNIEPEKMKSSLVGDLVLAGMHNTFIPRQRERCECCNGAHPTDWCNARGPEFQNPVLRKKVAQYNAIHGDKPKNPPPPSKPVVARYDRNGSNGYDRNRSNGFNRNGSNDNKLQYNAMSMRMNSVPTSPMPSPVPSPEPSPPMTDAMPKDQYTTLTGYTSDSNNSEQNPLQYRPLTISENAHFDNTLDKISEKLEEALDEGKILVDPTYALINLPTEQATSTPSNDIHDKRPLEDAMQVADYSVYGEQVNF
jgi:hypothetical protein